MRGGEDLDPDSFQEFADALRNLNGRKLTALLPHLSAGDVELALQALFSGMLVGSKIDPTNVLCAGDLADQQLNLQEHAIILYDAALQHMHENPETIASATNCAAASSNLIDLLVKRGERSRAVAAVNRAMQMPIKRADQKADLATWLSELR